MTRTFQPPEKTKDPLPEKPGGALKQDVIKKDEKSAPDKDAPGKTGQEAVPNKDVQPPEEQKQPVIPFQPPPGAQIAVPAKEPPKKFEIGSILIPALWLIGILAVGAILLSWLKKYRERQLGAVTLSANEQLSAFRQSLDEGEMTDDEFKKVKALLSEKLRKPAKPVAAAPVQETPTGEASNTNSPPS